MSRLAALACAGALLASMATAAASRAADPIAEIVDRDARMLATEVAALPKQRKGVPDLYAIGMAGDGTENVFRNEVEYFATLMRQRYHARGVLTLVSNPDSVRSRPRPLATYDNLYDAVQGVARKMDRKQDILLLYLTMHGTPEHELALYYPPYVNDGLVPDDIAFVLDEAGIRNRVIVISACYSGGFIDGLKDANTQLLTAARADRPSFGCGSDSNATFFGHAWLVEGLNRGTDFAGAFRYAEGRIAGWEQAEDFEPSHPQIAEGAAIKARLAAWDAQLSAGPAIPYPWPLEQPGKQAQAQARSP